MKSPRFDGTTDTGNLKKLPDTPGVYFFLDEDGRILYIGKATSLRDRVRSYFASDIPATRGPKIAKMLELVRSVSWQGVDSVLEAIVLESGLIREHQPPYNTDAKDDKSFNHVVITGEEYPRVLVVRGRDLAEGKFVTPIRSVYGPFPHGTQLREAVRIVRTIFPFRDKCEPPVRAAQHPGRAKRYPGSPETEKVPKRVRDTGVRPCFHRQIGLCPGVCTGEISAREYGRIIRNIELFFEGKKSEIVRKLTREMHRAASRLEFERANDIKATIFALGHIRDVSLLKREAGSADAETGGIRIEAYDVAHLGGKSSVGVMTVTRDGVSDTDEYRKFFLRGGHAGNDLTALEEILRRRLRHREWPKPDIVVVDGSFLQLGVAERLFAGADWSDVRIVGVVKNRKHQPERLEGDGTAIAEYRRDILLANAEAHRFAIGYHRRRRGKDFLA